MGVAVGAPVGLGVGIDVGSAVGEAVGVVVGGGVGTVVGVSAWRVGAQRVSKRSRMRCTPRHELARVHHALCERLDRVIVPARSVATSRRSQTNDKMGG